jgi:hypothetical protein
MFLPAVIALVLADLLVCPFSARIAEKGTQVKKKAPRAGARPRIPN